MYDQSSIVLDNNAIRKDYLDIAKGIGIVFVVLGHCPQVFIPIKQIIYAFHMPLFFFVSGIIWNRISHEKRGYCNISFISYKAKRLLIPCFFWAVIYSIINSVNNNSYSLIKILFLAYGNQIGFITADSLSSLWFLPCMFLAMCLFELIQGLLKKTNKHKVALLVISIASFTIGYFLPHLKYGFPWSIDVSFIALAFIIWGYLGQNFYSKEYSVQIYSIICFICLPLLFFSYRLSLKYISDNNISMAGRFLGNPALFLLNAFLGCILVVVLSKLLCRFNIIRSLLIRLGKHTLPILLLHKPIVFGFDTLFHWINMPSLFAVLLEVIFSIIICEAIYSVLNRFLPFIFGESR